MLKINFMVLYAAIVFSMLFVSCDSQRSTQSENTSSEIVNLANGSNQNKASSEVNKNSEIPNNFKEPKCKVYNEDEFRDEFTCLFFESSVFSYDKYSRQATIIEDCDTFYNDLKIKNDAICEKYKCSDKELEEYCDDEFEYADDTIANRNSCTEKKCPDYKFADECDGFESLCTEAIVLGCLNKSKLPPVDVYIAQCIDSNRSIIRNKCNKIACISLAVNECVEEKCKQKPTKEYYSKCKEESKHKCSTQNRVRLF